MMKCTNRSPRTSMRCVRSLLKAYADLLKVSCRKKLHKFNWNSSLMDYKKLINKYKSIIDLFEWIGENLVLWVWQADRDIRFNYSEHIQGNIK